MVVSTVLERNPEVIISGSLDLDDVSIIYMYLFSNVVGLSYVMTAQLT